MTSSIASPPARRPPARGRTLWLVADPPDRLAWVTGTAALASLLAGVSWLIAMRALPLGRVGRVLGLLVGAQTASIGLWSLVSASTGLIDAELAVSRLWWVSGELLAAALVLVMLYEFGQTRRGLVDVAWGVIALVGATTFGMLHWMAELLAFGGSLGKGEPAPRAGFGLAAVLLLCGATLLVRYRLLAPPRRVGSPEPAGRLARR